MILLLWASADAGQCDYNTFAPEGTRPAAGPRAKRLCLTPAGQALADRTVARIIRMENEVFAGWSPQEVETYLALTERFLQDLKARAAALDTTP